MSIEELRTKMAERLGEKGKVEAEALTKTTAAESEVNSNYDPRISKLKEQQKMAQEDLEKTQKLLTEIKTNLTLAKGNVKNISNDLRNNEREKAAALKVKIKEIQADKKAKLKYLNEKIRELNIQIKDLEKEHAKQE